MSHHRVPNTLITRSPITQYMFGVDEAGRGPVLGSMFVACVHVPERDVLPDGVDDSKQLATGTISDLATTLYNHNAVTTTVVEVPVTDIDAEGTSMPALTADAFADAIQQTPNTTTGVVDTIYADPSQTEDALHTRLPDDITVTAATDADADDPVVGAASILAKDARETHMDALNDEYAAYAPLGSGYASDDQTITFLETYVDDHGSLPACARESWETAREILRAAHQTDLSTWTDTVDRS